MGRFNGGYICAAVALGYKVALGVGTALVGWLLGGAGYEPDTENQSSDVLWAITVAFAWVPVWSVLAAMGVLLLYPRENTDKGHSVELSPEGLR